MTADDLFSSSANAPLSVSAVNRMARAALESQLPLFWVRGEITNLTRAASGHCYFSLKDDDAQVRCVLFRQKSATLPFRLENGQRVDVNALATLFETRGDFQLTVQTLRQVGQGALFEAFLRLKERLAGEGLFAATQKRALPPYPGVIGIVTSPDAAAFHDVCTALRRRAPQIRLVLYPTRVQGEQAPAELVSALQAASQRRDCALLLLVRGGGSMEDLQAFNEESVARAIAACTLPIISGIGHETDFTIADFVADYRAATPTAAAEIASAAWFEARAYLPDLARALCRSMRRTLEQRQQALDVLSHRLLHPRAALRTARERLRHMQQRLARAMQHRHEHCQARWQRMQTHLAALNPGAVLQRGYCLAYAPDGQLIRSSAQLALDGPLSLQFAHGQASAIVKTINPD